MNELKNYGVVLKYICAKSKYQELTEDRKSILLQKIKQVILNRFPVCGNTLNLAKKYVPEAIKCAENTLEDFCK